MFSSKIPQPPRRKFAFVILLFFIGGWLTQSTAAQAVAIQSRFDLNPEPAPVSLPVAAQDSEVTVGQTIAGTLDETDRTLDGGQFFDEYTFTGVEGQDILINLASSDFDAFLRLLDSAGELIAIDDDTGQGMGALISFTLPQSGTYTLQVASYTGGESGAYRLTLNEAPLLEPQASLSIAEEVEGELNHDRSRFNSGQFYESYTFEAVHGQALSVEMRSEQFDPYLWLLDPEGRIITVGDSVRAEQNEQPPARNNQQFLYLPLILDVDLSAKDQTGKFVLVNQAAMLGGNSTSRIIFFPSVSGSYTLLASSRTPLENGGYNLIVQPIPVPTEAEPLSGVVSGQLTAADVQLNAGPYVDVYSFQAEAGRPASLALEAVNFDSYLRVLDGRGNIIAENDDFESGTKNALIDNLALPETGSYYVWVSSVFSGETGDYTLSLSEGSLTATGQKSLSGSEEGIALVFSQKGSQVEPEAGAIGSLGKGQPFVGGAVCAGNSLSYTAKAKISIGDRQITDRLKMFITPDQGAGLAWPQGEFNLGPQESITLSPITIILEDWIDPGSRTVMASVSKLGSDQEEIHVIGLTSETVVTAPDNPDGARTKIGIGEEVTLSLTPDIPAAWSVVSGGGSVEPDVGGATTFTAVRDENPSKATVQAAFEGATCQLEFTVAPPTGLSCSFVKDLDLGTPGPTNNQIGAKARFHCTVAPTDVSFSNVKFQENRLASWTWHDGTPDTLSNIQNKKFPTAANLLRKTIDTGLDSINRIHNGNNFLDLSYSIEVREEFKDDASQWIQFTQSEQIIEYAGADQKARITIVTTNQASSGWAGPWQ